MTDLADIGAAPRSSGPLPQPGQIPSLTDEALDGLPFGVICLDRDGTILRYNLAEARLARLDRAQVLGKSFFRRVAPCTATPDFEGRVRAFFSSDRATDRFPYLFDFKFGAQNVEVELVRAPGGDAVYLLINRLTVLGPRPGLPEGFAAPLQQELAPTEADLGVQRDAAARRVVTIDASFFTSLLQTWVRVAPKAWPGFTREWGWQWGRHAVVDLEADTLEERGATLRDLTMREAMERVAHWAVIRGLGQLCFDFTPGPAGAFVVNLERSAVGEAVPRAGAPRCQLMEGLLEAVCEHLANRLLAVREVACCAQGHERCQFVVVSEKRKKALEEAIDGAAGSLEVVLGALS